MVPRRRPYSVSALDAKPSHRSTLPPVRPSPHSPSQREETPETPALNRPSTGSSLPPIKIYTVQEKKCTCSSRKLVAYGITLMVCATAVIIALILLHYFRVINWIPLLRGKLTNTSGS